MTEQLTALELYGFTAIGVIVLFSKSAGPGTRPYVLASITDKVFRSEDPGWLLLKEFTEFVIFVVLGVLIAVGLTHPSTSQQAIAAGLGWTGLLTQQRSVRTGSGQKKEKGASNAK